MKKKLIAFLPLLALLGCNSSDDPQPNPTTKAEAQTQVYTISYSKLAGNGQNAQLDNARIDVYTSEPDFSNGTYTMKPFTQRTSYSTVGNTPTIVDLPEIVTYAGGPPAKLRLVLSTSNQPAAGQALDVHLYQGRNEVFAAQHTSASAQLNAGRYETTAEYSIAPY
ncbi:hypothetical protein [Solirubrum puertoriconensis]|uniref:DUF1735 domain-containing protein n=1 Tax=Solirubrum puertoriconensis TaxID=1751427 RepID=A0A9X0HLJ5_SOLP1|nr:hypothetical protein [Solirubrum puertoriconensis]KUG08138.1 hypothetical protein ASU33_08050 [Solirubrum puertoriconensis]